MLYEKQGIEEELKNVAVQYNYKVRTIRDDVNDIIVLAKEEYYIKMIDEYPHCSLCKIRDVNKEYLLFVVHLSSSLYKQEIALNDALIELRQEVELMEKVHLNKESKSVLVGDFNLQPYAHGIVGVTGLNATMSKTIARREKRVLNKRERKYFYNPMWSVMGQIERCKGPIMPVKIVRKNQFTGIH